MPDPDVSSKPPPEEPEEFFQGLRALRAQKGLSLRDVAARIQIPADTLAEAETGPELPSLPILEAYLRGCEERLTPWEDWWRRLQPETEATATLPVRDSGFSLGEDVVPWDTGPRAVPSGRRRGTLALAAAVLLLIGGTSVVLLAQGSAGGGHAPRETATQPPPPAAAPAPGGSGLLPEPSASLIPTTTQPTWMAAQAEFPGTPAQPWAAASAQQWTTATPTQPAPVQPPPVQPSPPSPTPVQPTPVPPATSSPPVSPQPSVSPSATKTHCPGNQNNKGCGPKKGAGDLPPD